jgi:hypothetical protein
MEPIVKWRDVSSDCIGSEQSVIWKAIECCQCMK